MECLIGHGPMTRGDLAAKSGLAPATLSEITAGLAAENLIITSAVAKAGPGRPRQLLEANAGAGHVIGIKLSMHEATLALTNFAGTALGTVKVPHVAGRLTVRQSVEILAAQLRDLMTSMRLSQRQIAGIGLGIPGFVEHESGKCLWSPLFARDADQLGPLLSDAMQIPVRVDNDVNLVTLAERWFGMGRDCDNFLVITLEHGLGMGLFLNGELYCGPKGIAGEFAHMQVEPNGLACRCGRKGCLEAYVSDRAIATKASGIRGWLEPSDDAEVNQRMVDVTGLAMQGHAQLRALFADAGMRLGRAAANVANILAPEKVIVTGEAMRAEDLLMRPFADAFRECLLDVLPTGLAWHRNSDEIWAKGAAARVLGERFAGS